MELSKRQRILLIALGALALLLIGGLVLWIALDGAGDPIPEAPTLPATAIPSPTPTVTPEITPKNSPTPYWLPLVPDGTAPAVSTTPEPSATPEPDAQAVIRTDARIGTYNTKQKDFVAIGTQNGAAIAILLVSVKPPVAEITAVAAETLAPVYTLGENAEVQELSMLPIGTACRLAQTEKEGCWNLIWSIKNLTGVQPPHYLCVDFACMDAFFSFVPELESDAGPIDRDAFIAIVNESGETRASHFAQFGIGTVRYLSEVSLWELPAFRSATRGAFSSSLSFLELLSLMRALRGVETFTVTVLPAG